MTVIENGGVDSTVIVIAKSMGGGVCISIYPSSTYIPMDNIKICVISFEYFNLSVRYSSPHR